MEIRALTDDDADASLRASRDAFGGPLQNRSAYTTGPGVTRWGIFDGSVLAAKANDRDYTSMIGGRPISTAGVGGVLVAPEYRGSGLARQVMIHLLAAARERGAVISSLFRTAPALYRSLGYEQVAEQVAAELPTAALRGLRVRQPVTVRRAFLADAPAIRAVYARVAAQGSCLLTRTGPCFTATDQDMLDSFDGITLAIAADGSVAGYLTWIRGGKIGAEGLLTISELHAGDAAATEALLAVAGSFEAVTPTVRIRTSGLDPIHWVIPGAGWSVRNTEPYLIRVLDLAGAVAQRGWPAGLTGEVTFTVEDAICPWNTGSHRLQFAGGRAQLRPTPAADLRIEPRGLAVLMAGNVTTATLRRAGLISGGTVRDDQLLDATMAGPRPAIMDYF